MEPTNRGNFGAGVLGNTDSLRAAMDARGIDSSILDQVSGAAPSGPSNVAPNVPTTDPSLALGQAPQAPAAQGPQAPPARSFEMETALKAMSGVLRTENKIAESTLQLGGV